MVTPASNVQQCVMGERESRRGGAVVRSKDHDVGAADVEAFGGVSLFAFRLYCWSMVFVFGGLGFASLLQRQWVADVFLLKILDAFAEGMLNSSGTPCLLIAGYWYVAATGNAFRNRVMQQRVCWLSIVYTIAAVAVTACQFLPVFGWDSMERIIYFHTALGVPALVMLLVGFDEDVRPLVPKFGGFQVAMVSFMVFQIELGAGFLLFPDLVVGSMTNFDHTVASVATVPNLRRIAMMLLFILPGFCAIFALTSCPHTHRKVIYIDFLWLLMRMAWRAFGIMGVLFADVEQLWQDASADYAEHGALYAVNEIGFALVIWVAFVWFTFVRQRTPDTDTVNTKVKNL